MLLEEACCSAVVFLWCCRRWFPFYIRGIARIPGLYSPLIALDNQSYRQVAFGSNSFYRSFRRLFLLRSQKLSDDFKALLQASDELAANGFFKELEVSTGGELGRLAANLRKLNKGQQTKLTGTAEIESADAEEAGWSSEESMALILRMKTLLRLLDELKAAEGEAVQVDAVKREAAGLERFLVNLIAKC